ncbi:MAG TPA: hypothetical protein VHO24_16155 [Opitutaceae bacterium]|nr:hypothetical protein [Opitutaceae bacterium]
MNRHRRFFFATIAVVCALGIFQISRAVRARHEAEAALTKLLGPPSVAYAGTSARATNPAGAKAPSQGTLEAPPPAAVARPDASQLIAAHPEVLALFQTAFLARFESEYRTYFDQVALAPEGVARFKARLFRDKVDQLDLRWTGESQGAKRNDPVYQALRKQQEESLRADLQAIVGQAGYEALEQFRRANGVRGFVDELATGMTFAGQPMTLDQQDQLVQTIAEASARFQKGGSAMPWDANWDAIMAQAPSFLSDAQVAALRENGDERVRFVWRLPEFYAQHRAEVK